MPNTKHLKDFTQQIRRDIVRMVHQVQSGHPGGSLSANEFMSVMFQEIMDYKLPFNTEGHNEDMFFLSNGHITPAYYSILARSGYFPVSELATFRQLGTRLQGHPSTHDGLPGVRIASGSLGQGLSVALGVAQAKKLNGDKHLVYTLQGDGELQEGQIWEAVMYAGAKGIDNLIMSVDYNKAQIDGFTDNVVSLGDLKAKFESFEWSVVEVEHGNDIEAVIKGMTQAKALTGQGKPVAVLLHTEMGYGVDFMMGTYKWHGSPLNDEQLATALEQNPETLGDY